MPDRYGDDAEPNRGDTTTVPHNPDCSNGFLGTDLDGRMIPCLKCRPHLRDGNVRTNDFGAR